MQQNEKKAAASGICEIVTEEEQLLDEFLLEIREETSEHEMKKKISSQAEEKLVNAGKKIQSMALERAALKKLALPSTAKKRTRSDDDDWNEWIAEISSDMATQKCLRTEKL